MRTRLWRWWWWWQRYKLLCTMRTIMMPTVMQICRCCWWLRCTYDDYCAYMVIMNLGRCVWQCISDDLWWCWWCICDDWNPSDLNRSLTRLVLQCHPDQRAIGITGAPWNPTQCIKFRDANDFGCACFLACIVLLFMPPTRRTFLKRISWFKSSIINMVIINTVTDALLATTIFIIYA